MKSTTTSSLSKLDNPIGFKVLVTLSMVYMSIMLCNAILTNRYVGNDTLFILGGTLTSPFVFILDDMVAEIYGYKITQWLIITGFLSQTLFTLICLVVVKLPHPEFFHHNAAYAYILGASLLRIDLSGFFAYIAANLINSFILTRWKILLKGRKFWLRSLGSSTFSEAFYSMIAILLMEIRSIPLHNIGKVILMSYSIKAIYSLLFSVPGQLLVSYIKRLTHIDVYDLPLKFTPFAQEKGVDSDVNP